MTLKSLLRFVVPGDPVGYIAGPRRHSGAVARRQAAWRSSVRVCYQEAIIARLTDAESRGFLVGTKLYATMREPVRVSVTCHFRSLRHPDVENVRKGIVDILFYKAPGGDKYVAGSHDWPQYDSTNPRTEVWVERWGPTEGVGEYSFTSIAVPSVGGWKRRVTG